jgi:arylsulfatase A-like enzyme
MQRVEYAVKPIRPGTTALLTAALLLACSRAEPVLDAAPKVAEKQAAAIAPPPLIILLSIDTLRADHLGAYGYERFTSPMLDAVAREGVLFEDASAPSSWTLPSHASMLTGLYPASHRLILNGGRLPDGIPTLAALLKPAGYSTAAVVNSVWLKQTTFQVTRDFEKFQQIKSSPQRMKPNTWITDQAIEWIGDAGDQPLFLFIHYYDVHSDYVSQPEFERLFVEPYDGFADGSGWQLFLASLEDEFIQRCKTDFDEDRCVFGSSDTPRPIDGTSRRPEFGPEDVKHLIDLYDAGIRQLDTELARLFGFLRDAELAESTLLIITSDHGEEFMEHGGVEHFMTQYQESIRVPLIIRGPGVPAGRRIATPVSLVDIVPTILHLAGAVVEPELQGHDLSSLWSDTPDPAFERRFLYGEAPGGLSFQGGSPGVFRIYRSVREGRYKLIHEQRDDRYALFDLQEDPTEQIDILAREPVVAARLRAEMLRRYSIRPAEVEDENQVELSPEDREQLKALGYIR